MTDRAGAAGLRLKAPAKINLYLRVVGRRDDGYHLVDSVVAFADASDAVTAAASTRIALEIDGPFAETLDDGVENLMVRAARALAAEAPGRRGAALGLTKNLPVAAGIGGGSADAAATIRLLDRLWRLDGDEDRLERIGLSLGADVPACLRGGTLRVGGIGEILEPAPRLPPMAIVLVNNGRAVETAAVFGARRGAFSEPAPPLDHLDDAEAVARSYGALGNDLADAAIRIEPSIGEVLAALEAENGCLLAQLSGSGGTCFAMFDSPDMADRAATRLSASHRGWWVRACRFLNTRPDIEEPGAGRPT